MTADAGKVKGSISVRPEANRRGASRIQVREDLCRDCQACLLVCSLAHEGVCGPSLARLTVSKDMLRYEFYIRICEHCEEPACEAACPSGALAADERGISVIDDDLCTRCGSCADACPHQAIVYAESVDRYLKCDLCAGHDEPLCAVVCPVEALTLRGK
jgi:carbon-monoxide dehydrogenase iron sulfur subunit